MKTGGVILKRKRELERAYIDHFIRKVERLTEDEAREFLAILRTDTTNDYRERRITNLDRYLAQLERNRQTAKKQEREWIAAAREYKALTERWEKLGAKWRAVGPALTVWEYNGTEFYRWWSGSLITDNIVEARRADERLTEMIFREKEDEISG